MNFYSDLTALNLCGIYELDAGGQIVYCGTHSSDGYFKRNSKMVGSNFYEIAGFDNVEDFRRKIKFFLQTPKTMEKFDFDCRFSECVTNVKVKLVRVSERECKGSSAFVIVDIRKI